MRQAITTVFLLLASASTSCEKQCLRELSDLGRSCPKTFDGTEEQLPECTYPVQMEARVCEGLIVLSLGGGYTGMSCVYFASSHELVGASAFSDIQDFCDGESFQTQAGRLPADEEACRRSPPRVTKRCTVSDRR